MVKCQFTFTEGTFVPKAKVSEKGNLFADETEEAKRQKVENEKSKLHGNESKSKQKKVMPVLFQVHVYL